MFSYFFHSNSPQVISSAGTYFWLIRHRHSPYLLYSLLSKNTQSLHWKRPQHIFSGISMILLIFFIFLILLIVFDYR